MRIDFKLNIETVGLNINVNQMELKANIRNFQRVIATEDSVEKYDGKYEVTPTVHGETLPTNQKFMEKDLTVNPIPIYETTNNSGGQTVYIAKE